MKVIYSDTKERMSWIFSVNHGINDQKSTIALVSELLEYIHNQSRPLHSAALHNHSMEESKEDPELCDDSSSVEYSVEYTVGHQKEALETSTPLPISLETALTHGLNYWKILKWAMRNAFIKAPVEAAYVPAKLNRNYTEDPVKYAHYNVGDDRRSFVVNFTLSKEETDALVLVCRANNVTVTSALSAATLCVTSLFLQLDNMQELTAQNLKSYVTVDTRRYGSNPHGGPQSSLEPAVPKHALVNSPQDWTGGRMACASHCIDFIVSVPLSAVSHAKDIYDFETHPGQNKEPVRTENPEFWVLAKECRAFTREKVENELDLGVLFFEFLIDEIGLLSIIDAPGSVNDPLKMGRDSPCGVSNVGVIDFNTCLESGSGSASQPGRVSVKEAYFGSGGGRGGSYSFLSSQTVNGCLNNSLHFADPLTTRDEALLFKKCFVTILKELLIF